MEQVAVSYTHLFVGVGIFANTKKFCYNKPSTLTPYFLYMVCLTERRWLQMNTYTTSEVAKIIGIHPNTVRLYEE